MKSDFSQFSIIIPTRNEQQDIVSTVRACINIDYPNKEIIVVDDSTDNTCDIINRTFGGHVKLVHRGLNENGCCGARNLGMKLARGEYIILLNADAKPKPDYIARILSHYKKGADYIIVRSNTLRSDSLWATYLKALETMSLTEIKQPEWSEGFSCRKTSAEKVGYIPGNFPIPFCRDWRLGELLRKNGFKKVIDYSISMDHTAPDELGSFWRNQIWRSSMWAPTKYYFEDKSKLRILFEESAKLLLRCGIWVLLFPIFIRAIQYVRSVSKEWTYIIRMMLAKFIQDAAHSVGALKGVCALAKVR